jgi:hypothetical protein
MRGVIIPFLPVATIFTTGKSEKIIYETATVMDKKMQQMLRDNRCLRGVEFTVIASSSEGHVRCIKYKICTRKFPPSAQNETAAHLFYR